MYSCSPMYQRFVNVMCNMTGDERKVSSYMVLKYRYYM